MGNSFFVRLLYKIACDKTTIVIDSDGGKTLNIFGLFFLRFFLNKQI